MSGKKSSPTESLRSRLAPQDEFEVNGVRFIITPLPYWKLTRIYAILTGTVNEILNSLQGLESVDVTMGDTLSKTLAVCHEQVASILDECVSIPEAPDFPMRELPAKIVPKILRIVVEQNLDMGELRGLAQIKLVADIKNELGQAWSKFKDLTNSLQDSLSEASKSANSES